MPIESEGTVTEIEDKDDNVAAPASDERLESMRQEIRDRLGNWSGLTAVKYTTSGTTAEQVGSNDVPEGVSVLVQALEGNTGTVYVGDSTTQPVSLQPEANVSLAVTNTDKIHVRADNGGDGVGILFEG